MTRRTRHTFGVLLDLGLLAASVTVSGPVPNAVRTIGVIAVAILAGLVVLVAACLAWAIMTTRQPPYEV
jgi:hypothetical protein